MYVNKKPPVVTEFFVSSTFGNEMGSYNPISEHVKLPAHRAGLPGKEIED
jgi:hypothetical protein